MARFISSLASSLCAATLVACSSGSPSASSNDAITTSSPSVEVTTSSATGVNPPSPSGAVTPSTSPTAAPPSSIPATGTLPVETSTTAGSSSTTATVATTSVAGDSSESGGVSSDGAEETVPTTSDGAPSTNAETAADTSGPVVEDGDLTPPRPLNVTAAKARHEHDFRASAADSTVSYNDNDQIAVFDNRAATLMGKLVLTFGGAGETNGNLTESGKFCAQRGFHVLAVAAFQAYDIVSHGPEFYGLARRTVFEGVMYTKEDAFANITLTKADGVAQRTQKALQYLHATYPDEDWGYYLQEDGSVRWSDVIFTGMSHGASNSARFGSLVRASRVVSVGGPRDNLCQRVDLNNCGGDVATWYDEEHLTPIDRYYTITGVQDDQHTQHLFAMEKLGYTGEATRVDSTQPPYNGSHRLVHPGGHDDLCTNQTYKNLCNYAFGVPTENQAGTGQ